MLDHVIFMEKLGFNMNYSKVSVCYQSERGPFLEHGTVIKTNNVSIFVRQVNNKNKRKKKTETKTK